jgi:hypothetical protein
MFADLIKIVGVWFLIACVAEALAVFVEQAGAARSPDDETKRGSGVALLSFVASLLTPGLLLAHGFLATHGAEQSLRVLAMGAPIAAVLLGALVGAIAGALLRAAAPAMRTLALPLDLAALAVAIYATLPSIRILLGAMQNGGVILQ